MNFVNITVGGKEYRLKLRAAYMDELERRIGGALSDKLPEINRLGLCTDIIAYALDPEHYPEAKKLAARIYDDMIDEGKDLTDYQLLVTDVLVASGFMSAEAAAAQKTAARAQTRLAELIAAAEAEKAAAKLKAAEERLKAVPTP
ncbi:MAG: hypothetical protein NC084_12845 [Bacteroides sp.]|nr:hypothetical protein [Eubacterium sp.]MCM1419619.1 hypothetical protein [Roseburia sp.]MCM1463582.1 hypothetical protein [Bacteroides sp.]